MIATAYYRVCYNQLSILKIRACQVSRITRLSFFVFPPLCSLSKARGFGAIAKTCHIVRTNTEASNSLFGHPENGVEMTARAKDTRGYSTTIRTRRTCWTAIILVALLLRGALGHGDLNLPANSSEWCLHAEHLFRFNHPSIFAAASRFFDSLA